MMGRATRIAFALAIVLAQSGCVASRQIVSVTAHETYNSYKLHVATTRSAVVAFWTVSEVWTCHKEGERFRCAAVDHDAVKRGLPGAGAIGPPPQPAPSASWPPATSPPPGTSPPSSAPPAGTPPAPAPSRPRSASPAASPPLPASPSPTSAPAPASSPLPASAPLPF